MSTPTPTRMRAVVMRDGVLRQAEVARPEPAAGELLLRTLACGICGSDLHMARDGRRYVARSRAGGAPFTWYDPDEDVILGHELCGEVVEVGAGVEGIAVGDRVVAMPVIAEPGGVVHTIGLSNRYGGGFGEYLLVSGDESLVVPPGLDSVAAALTEPLAVGRHVLAAARALHEDDLGAGDVALVIGCGPIGLATIAWLADAGVGTIVASERVETRRRLAAELGATIVVDPGAQDPFAACERLRGSAGWRDGSAPAPPIVVDAVGAPGILATILRRAPLGTRVVVAGIATEPDEIEPLFAVEKELRMRFCIGWTREEFRASLDALATGRIDLTPIVTSVVGPDRVAEAFAGLLAGGDEAKVLVAHPPSHQPPRRRTQEEHR